jgi:hypothetical protein
MHTSLSLHFIDVQSLDMFRALLAHLQETLHERRFGDYCVQLQMWVGLRIAHNSNQFCVRLVPPEDGQVMPETCREIEHQ